VEVKDLMRVYEDSEEIYKLLNTPYGFHKSFYAIAHPQCEKHKPLRFFVVNDKADIFQEFRSLVIINPVIIRHTEAMIDSEEGCATFPTMPANIVKRWNKCEVEFNTLDFDKENNPVMSARKTLNISGKLAKVFQHEVDHLNAKYIY
jgi:peptide deformylase